MFDMLSVSSAKIRVTLKVKSLGNPFIVWSLLIVAALACASLPATTAAPIPTFTVPPRPTQVPVLLTAAPQPTVAGAPPIVLDPSAEEEVYTDLYNRVSPAVVSIRIFSNNGLDDGLGSGFVIDTEGHIVTNNHVVEGADQLEVDFSSGVKAWAEVVGTDPTADLAVVKVDVPAEQLTALPLADSDLVQVGQRVIAIGNPFGLSGTMTVGIVSGLGRILPTDVAAPGGGQFSAPDIIQTDAAVNPGNSGGPLLNLKGEVIGINQSIRTETGVNSGISFAIASNTVRRIVPVLIKDGKFVYPYLGVTSSDDLTLSVIEELKLPQTTGAYVTQVSSGGPADQAGVRGDRGLGSDRLQGGGDLIIAIDGHPVKTFSDLLSYLVNETSVGQKVTLTVLRDGSQQDIEVTLGARP